MSHILRFTDPEAALDAIRTEIPDDAPDWTENICWQLNDPASGVGLYAHMGRMQPDRRIWEGLTLFYLPDGSSYVSRSLGANPAAARNGEYDYRPVIPAKSWRYDFEGVVQRVDPKALEGRPVGDEPFEAASYHLTFDALQPVYNMHQSRAGSDRMHLDHGGRIHGTLDIGGKRYTIDAAGYRDHSVSRRTFLTLDSESWANGLFPSGRIFSYLQVSRKERQILDGQALIDGEMTVITPLTVPELTDTGGGPHAGLIRIEAGGKTHEISWKTSPEKAIIFQLLNPVGLRPGVDPALSESLVAVQCPCEYVWDGETGHGWLERLRPLASLAR